MKENKPINYKGTIKLTVIFLMAFVIYLYNGNVDNAAKAMIIYAILSIFF